MKKGARVRMRWDHSRVGIIVEAGEEVSGMRLDGDGSKQVYYYSNGQFEIMGEK